MKSFAIFCLYEAQFGCFCQGYEGDKPHWNVFLILSEYYFQDLPLVWSKASEYKVLILPDH